MKGLFEEGANTTSSKRVVGFIGAMVLFGSLVLSHFTDFKPAEYQFNAVAILVGALMGYTSIEKFKKKL